MKVKRKWRDIRPSMVTHTRNLCSAFNPSKVHTHSSEHTHTHRGHTPGAVGSHLCCGAWGAVGGSVSCSRAPQSWYWGWRERCTFTPPTYNSCRTWDSNSQPFDYESHSLTIRPRLPPWGNCHFWHGVNHGVIVIFGWTIPLTEDVKDQI